MRLPEIQPILTNNDDRLHRVADRLNQLGCRVCNLWISTYEDALILHGQVTTNYAKDLVQHVVMEITGQSILSNDVQVE